MNTKTLRYGTSTLPGREEPFQTSLECHIQALGCICRALGGGRCSEADCSQRSGECEGKIWCSGDLRGRDGQGFRASWIWRARESQDECR